MEWSSLTRFLSSSLFLFRPTRCRFLWPCVSCFEHQHPTPTGLGTRVTSLITGFYENNVCKGKPSLLAIAFHSLVLVVSLFCGIGGFVSAMIDINDSRRAVRGLPSHVPAISSTSSGPYPNSHGGHNRVLEGRCQGQGGHSRAKQ
jgi:hypothetical protein